jgi:hypothetical protein
MRQRIRESLLRLQMAQRQEVQRAHPGANQAAALDEIATRQPGFVRRNGGGSEDGIGHGAAWG